MDTLTKEQVQIALARLERPLARYSWLQRQVRLRDVSVNDEFQRRFSGFYRVRRNLQWRAAYFGLLESEKANGINFPDALGKIARRCGRIEASFASKLVATLDASKPVIDKFVLGYFKMELPRSGSTTRPCRRLHTQGLIPVALNASFSLATKLSREKGFCRKPPSWKSRLRSPNSR